SYAIGEVYLVQFRLPLQNCYLRFEVRGLNVRDEPPFEPGVQTFFKRRDLARRTVARYDNLFLGIIKRVEGMEKLFLRPFFAGKKLDVVHQQDVNVAVFIPESYGLVVSDRVYQFVHKTLRG